MDAVDSDLRPTWSKVVSKEVTDKFQEVTSDMSNFQQKFDEFRVTTISSTKEEVDRELRAHNIIIYEVTEAETREERKK